MSRDSQDFPDWPAPIVVPPAGTADSGPVADAVVALWKRVNLALHPIIGQRGVAALYQRSLKLTAPAHPWLGVGLSGLMAEVDTEALHSLLAQQTAAQAAEAGNLMFHEFRRLLSTLIGSSLTHRLLRGIWGPPTAGTTFHDSST